MVVLLWKSGLKIDKLKRSLLGLLREDSGQGLIEYALMVATMAVVIAGFLPPTIMPAVSTIFSKITSTIAIS